MVKLTCPRSTSRGIWHSPGIELRSRNFHLTSSTTIPLTHIYTHNILLTYNNTLTSLKAHAKRLFTLYPLTPLNPGSPGLPLGPGSPLGPGKPVNPGNPFSPYKSLKYIFFRKYFKLLFKSSIYCNSNINW